MNVYLQPKRNIKYIIIREIGKIHNLNIAPVVLKIIGKK